VAAAVGPLLGLFVFAATGNSWSPFSMKVVPLAMQGFSAKTLQNQIWHFSDTCGYDMIQFF